jgi:hypothetical protein
LDFLGFIRPNRDFSMGYGEKNKKNSRLLSPPPGAFKTRVRSGEREGNTDSDFRKEIAPAFCFCARSDKVRPKSAANSFSANLAARGRIAPN